MTLVSISPSDAQGPLLLSSALPVLSPWGRIVHLAADTIRVSLSPPSLASFSLSVRTAAFLRRPPSLAGSSVPRASCRSSPVYIGCVSRTHKSSGPPSSFARMGSAKPRGPRKSLIFGESGGQMPTLSGPPKSCARMRSAESEVGATAAELQVIPPFLPTILGSSESFARMGSAESEVGSTAAELQVIPTFLPTLSVPHRASLEW